MTEKTKKMQSRENKCRPLTLLKRAYNISRCIYGHFLTEMPVFIKNSKSLKMKRKGLVIISCIVAICGIIILAACGNDDGVMTKKKGVYTINTTSLSQEVIGYNGPTPLLITIENDKVTKVEALENSETPRFFEHMTKGGILNSWDGMSVDDALNAKVDAVAGATFSSNAVIKNMQMGLQYYKDHKK